MSVLHPLTSANQIDLESTQEARWVECLLWEERERNVAKFRSYSFSFSFQCCNSFYLFHVSSLPTRVSLEDKKQDENILCSFNSKQIEIESFALGSGYVNCGSLLFSRYALKDSAAIFLGFLCLITSSIQMLCKSLSAEHFQYVLLLFVNCFHPSVASTLRIYICRNFFSINCDCLVVVAVTSLIPVLSRWLSRSMLRNSQVLKPTVKASLPIWFMFIVPSSSVLIQSFKFAWRK